MKDHHPENIRLLYGPYRSPKCRLGSSLAARRAGVPSSSPASAIADPVALRQDAGQPLAHPLRPPGQRRSRRSRGGDLPPLGRFPLGRPHLAAGAGRACRQSWDAPAQALLPGYRAGSLTLPRIAGQDERRSCTPAPLPPVHGCGARGCQKAQAGRLEASHVPTHEGAMGFRCPPAAR